MQSAAVDGDMSMGIRLLYAPSFSSALIKPYGWPTILAPEASA